MYSKYLELLPNWIPDYVEERKMNSDLFLINPKIALALANRELSASLDKIFGSWNMRCMKFY